VSRSAIALLFLCALAAWTLLTCKNEPSAPAAPKAAAKPAPPSELQHPTPDTDVENALNLMYGTAVVWRGGENDLENSAVHALDGFLDTTWTSAPGSPEETLVYSFLAARRIERVGATLVKTFAIDSVAFDASMDGKTWHELAKLKLENNDQQQLVSVKPTDARYVRVRTFDPAGKYYVRVRTFHAMGAEVEPPRTPSFGGCWKINGVPAHIEQNGARITGVIETVPPIHLDGGTSDNRFGMVMWMQGGTRGEAVLTRSGDGEHITGLRFYEDVDSSNMGEGWFGERCEGRRGAGGTAAGAAAPQQFLARAKRYSLYGLAFDRNDRLIEEVSGPVLDTLVSLIASSPQRMSLVAHELRYAIPEQNKQHAAARLQALRAALQARGVDLRRIDFVAAGSDRNGSSLSSALQQAALSRVDLIFGT
jgi:hypothetical protein